MKKALTFFFAITFLINKSQISPPANYVGLTKANEIYTMGDSQTSNGGFQTQLISLLGPAWNAVNYGVPGNTTAQMVVRFTAITNATANTVIILGGANDLIGSITATTIISNLQYMCTAAHNTGSKVILMTTTPFGSNVGWTSGKQTTQNTVNTAILTTTSITNVDYRLDIYTLLGGGTNSLSAIYDSGDGLHWNSAGQTAVGNYIFANSGFTITNTNPVILLGKNISLSQNITPLSQPVFKGLILNDSLKLGANPIGCGPINSTGTSSLSNIFSTGAASITGSIYSNNLFGLLGGNGGYFTNGGTSIKFLSGTSYPDLKFCTVNNTNGVMGLNNTTGFTLIGDQASMVDDGINQLQVKGSVKTGTLNVSSSAAQINFLPLSSTNAVINWRNFANTVNRAYISLNESSGDWTFGTSTGGYWPVFQANATEAARFNGTQDFGVGTGTLVSARLHVVKTTEQLRLGYDASNYYKTTVGSSGGIILDAVGSGSSFTFSDNIIIPHLIGNTSVPTITAGIGAGTSPTISITGTDLGGYITLITGTTPTLSANVFTISFNTAYGVAPRMISLSPAEVNSATLSGTSEVYIDQSNITTTSFISTVGSTALTPATIYKWYYVVIQ